MFFWFHSDTFSIIDALTKLILVITGSVLIICFCHKLTNYKKTRRYKYDFTRTDATGLGAAAVVWRQQQQTNGDNTQPASQSLSSSAPYDPYNTIRPLFGAPFASPQAREAYLSVGQTFQVPLGAVAYGYHHPGGAAAAVVAFQQAAAATDLSGEGSTSANTPSDQQQVGEHDAQAQQSHVESCPSYEEAVASGLPPAETGVHGGSGCEGAADLGGGGE